MSLIESYTKAVRRRQMLERQQTECVLAMNRLQTDLRNALEDERQLLLEFTTKVAEDGDTV